MEYLQLVESWLQQNINHSFLLQVGSEHLEWHSLMMHLVVLS